MFTKDGNAVSTSVVKGEVVQEVRQVIVQGRIEQVFRLYAWSDVLEIEYRVGPIDIEDGLGKEVISRFVVIRFVLTFNQLFRQVRHRHCEWR